MHPAFCSDRVGGIALTRREFIHSAALSAIGLSLAPLLGGEKIIPQRRVLVVGGGVAGLAAVQRLRLAGVETVLLEARERLGGRIWTGESGWDFGASWIHGRRGNPVVGLAREVGARTLPFDYDNHWRFDALGELSAERDRAIEADFAVLEMAIARAQRQAASKVAFAGIVQKQLAALDGTRRVGLRYAVNSNITLEYAADPAQLSLAYFDTGAAQAGGDLVFPGGYAQILSALGRPAELRLGDRVRRISWSEGAVKVASERGEVAGQAAIVTLPLGVLKSGEVQFDPGLPGGHRRAIERLGFGTLNKLFLQFPEVRWPREPEMFGYLGDGWWEEWLNLVPVTGQPVLVGFNGGSVAEETEKLSERELVEGAMKVLRSMFGRDLPWPTRVFATRWKADPFSRGAYSHYAPGSTVQDRKVLASPVAGNLIFAGEACSVDHPSTVHGALVSGWRAADFLLRRLSEMKL
jgi:monoamine oxidase